MEKIIVLLIFLVACSCPELTMDEVHFKTVDCKNKCINQSNKTMIEYRFSYSGCDETCECWYRDCIDNDSDGWNNSIARNTPNIIDCDDNKSNYPTLYT